MILIQDYNPKFSSILNKIRFFNLEIDQLKRVNNYALKHPKLVPIAVEDNEPIGVAIGSIDKEKAWLIGFYIIEEFEAKFEVIINQLFSYLEQQVNSDVLSWNIRMKPEFKKLIPVLKKIGYTTVEKLNLYKNEEITFPPQTLPLKLYNGIIREAKLDDINSLIRIEKKCFESYWIYNKNTWIDLIQGKGSLSLVNVFEITLENGAKKLIGYNYNSVSKNKGHLEGQYIRIGTDPEYRTIGIAAALTEKAFKWFKEKNVDLIYLSTIKSDKQLNKMYQLWKFTKFGEEIILTKLNIRS
ncbi:MAG: GNAT family N-acetyltransferase [Candidatus Hodarchaeales archaeon]|jgi:ribosomal protein S18 acetylase RimI-like enzyme